MQSKSLLGDGLILLITIGFGYLKNQNQITTIFWYLKTNSKLKNQWLWLFQKTSKNCLAKESPLVIRAII
jgi:hypothetical protein